MKKATAVKVYMSNGTVRYGEVIGHGIDGKLLLLPARELANKPLASIDLFRDEMEVRFIYVDKSNYEFKNPQA